MTNTATPQDAGREGDGESSPLTPAATLDSDAQPDGAAAPPDLAKADGQEAGAGSSGDTPLVVPPRYRPSYVFLGVVSLITLAADLGTKWWATERLTAPKITGFRKIEVIKDHLNLIFAKNHGGAWGILGDESEAIRRPFFLVISLAAVVFIISLFRKLHPSQHALRWGLPLVLGGALGNLVDRIRYGYVVDFIQVYVTPAIPSTYPWPTFNVADVAIVAGVILMAIDMFVPRRTQGVAEPRAGEKAPTGER